MDARLRRLIVRMLARIEPLMSGLEAGTLTATQWAEQFSQALAEGHVEAIRAGGVQAKLPAAQAVLTTQLATQLHFLQGFRQVIVESAGNFQSGWNARAAMYAQSVGAPYWSGRTKLLPLPALPKDGTTSCLTNCGCSWDIRQLAGDGNYDCTWRRGKDDSCDTCFARERLWSPLRIRDGRVV